MATNLDEVRVKLISILGRMITVEEIRDAMGLKTSTFYDQRREGRLITLENVHAAARALGVNEVYLLVQFGLLDQKAIDSYMAYVASGDTGPLLVTPKNIRQARGSLPDTPDL